VIALACYCGDFAQGERVLHPWRTFGPPLADSVAAIDYVRLADTPGVGFGLAMLGPLGTLRVLVDSMSPQPPFGHWRGASLLELDDAAIETFEERARIAPEGWSIGIGHHMRGAVCRVDPSATALLREPGTYSYFVHASWREAQQTEDAMRWVDRSWEHLRAHSSPATQINYLSVGSESAVATSYGDNYRRLAALKARVDADNVFHLNRNIRPRAMALTE